LKNGKIKIADLGSAKNLENTIERTSNKGTRLYRSPEKCKFFEENKKLNVTFKTDVWSAGIVFYELITFKLPFEELSNKTSLEAPILPQDVPCLFQSLINKYKIPFLLIILIFSNKLNSLKNAR
jgi:serine/threonine protein kinase